MKLKTENVNTLIDNLRKSPSQFAYTPVNGKKSYLSKWNTRERVDRDFIINQIKSGRATGYGLLTGDISGGVLAIDVDGASAEPMLDSICSNLPETMCWSSGKPGRRQLLFQLTDEQRKILSDIGYFKKLVIKELGNIKCVPGEQLEFRFNEQQSVQAYSYHPDTGLYKPVNDAPPAFLPDDIFNFIIANFKNEGLSESSKKYKKVESDDGVVSYERVEFDASKLSPIKQFLYDEVLPWLSFDQIFSWEGHEFFEDGIYRRGNCPMHKSISGTAFKVNTDTFEWYCHNDKIGGNVVEYYHYCINLRDHNEKPTQSEIENIVYELAELACIDVPTDLDNRLVRSEYEKKNQFTYKNDFHGNIDELPSSLPIKGLILAREFMGWGKSSKMIAPYMRILERLGFSSIAINSRRSLAREFSAKTNSTYQDDVKNLESVVRLTCVADSIRKFIINEWIQKSPWGVVFIDEAVSVIKHILMAKTDIAAHRSETIAEFIKMISEAECVVLADANLTDIEVNAIKPYLKHKQIYTVNSGELPPQKYIKLAVGGNSEREYVLGKMMEQAEKLSKAIDSGNSYQEIIDKVGGIAIPSDSQSNLKAIHELIVSTFPNLEKYIIRADKETTPEPELIKFVENPNNYILENGLLMVLWSPSLVVGISIVVDMFKHGFVFYHGVIEPKEMRQQMTRVRACSNWFGYTTKNGMVDDSITSSDELKYRHKEGYKTTRDDVNMWDEMRNVVRERAESNGIKPSKERANQIITSTEIEYETNPMVQAYFDIKTRETFAKMNCGDIFQSELKNEQNFVVEIINCGSIPESPLADDIKERKTAHKEEIAKIVFSGCSISHDERERIQKSNNRKYEEVLQAQGYDLQKIIPNFDVTPDFILNHKVKDPRWISGVRNYFDAMCIKIAKKRDAERIYKYLEVSEQTMYFLPDVKLRYKKAELFRKIGLIDDEGLTLSNGWYDATTPQIIDIHKSSKRRTKSIKIHLGIEVDDDPIRYVNKLLSKKLSVAVAKKTIKGKAFYKIAQEEDFIVRPGDDKETVEGKVIKSRSIEYHKQIVRGLIIANWDLFNPMEKIDYQKSIDKCKPFEGGVMMAIK